MRNLIEEGDVIRIAVDLRRAKNFESFWNEPPQDPRMEQRDSLSSSSRLLLNSLGGIRLRSQTNNLSVFMNSNNELLFLNSPCKLHFAYNGSEFHDGVDINLMSLANAPLAFNVSLLEVGYAVQLSKCVYFEDWESIPKQPFLLS